MATTAAKQFSLTTERLTVKPLRTEDHPFVHVLVNSEGWLKFIGNRNISNAADAIAYIKRILQNKDIRYWVVRLKEDEEPIGVVTFIQRDYLEHPDIGFAFLPKYTGKGYAYEATTAVLKKIIQVYAPDYVLATTLPENESSIRLLKKMGLHAEKELTVGDAVVQVYKAASQELVFEIT